MPFVPTRDRIKPEEIQSPPQRRPEWIRVPRPFWRNLRTAAKPDAQ